MGYICFACGTENNDEARFCKICGSAINLSESAHTDNFISAKENKINKIEDPKNPSCRSSWNFLWWLRCS